MKSGPARAETLQWHFCGNFPRSHLPLKLYSSLMLVLLVTCGSQISSAHQPLNICDGVSVWWRKKNGERKKVALLLTPQRIWAICIHFCSPCQLVKLDPYSPLPWRHITSYTSGCTRMLQRHKCSRGMVRTEQHWLNSAIARVFPIAVNRLQGLCGDTMGASQVTTVYIYSVFFLLWHSDELFK